MTSLAPVGPGFPAVRIRLNALCQVGLGVFLCSKITANLFAKPFAWQPLFSAALTILLCIGLVLVFAAALKGHEPSWRLLRCYWSTERGSKRLFVVHSALTVSGLIYLIAPALMAYVIPSLPIIIVVGWWIRRTGRQ